MFAAGSSTALTVLSVKYSTMTSLTATFSTMTVFMTLVSWSAESGT